ncbi:MAG: transposase domain-containing protein, partial [Myxococcaceae bacterium]|nr:transposase domain-containing protein [Myxococcaceae bacterium]
SHEPKFRRFLERPEPPMEHNLFEQQLRQPVVGREAWLFAGSEGGAHAAAMTFSLVGSCVQKGVDPQASLVDVLDRIQDHPANRAAELTPLNWRRVQDGLPLLGQGSHGAVRPGRCSSPIGNSAAKQGSHQALVVPCSKSRKLSPNRRA